MATKAKRTKKATETPAAPPQSVRDVLLHECISNIDEKVCCDYAIGMFKGPNQKMSDKESKDFVKALALFASLGWTYYHSKKNGTWVVS